MPRTHTGDKNRPYRRHRSHVTENKLGKRPATSTRNINILKMSEDLVVAAAWALLLLLQLGNVVSNVVHVGCTPGCWLARLLSLSDPYCQSMCLCVCVSVCLSANLMLNISEAIWGDSCPIGCLQESGYGASIGDVIDGARDYDVKPVTSQSSKSSHSETRTRIDYPCLPFKHTLS